MNFNEIIEKIEKNTQRLVLTYRISRRAASAIVRYLPHDDYNSQTIQAHFNQIPDLTKLKGVGKQTAEELTLKFDLTPSKAYKHKCPKCGHFYND